MNNIELTEEQTEQTIFALCYHYQVFNENLSLETAFEIATQGDKSEYFSGLIKGLNIVYPIPVEPDPEP